MDRRWWGTAMVVLAMLAALVVPNLAGRRIDGSATRVPIPDPPQVGQCLLADITGQRSALNYSQVVVVAAPVGPCADANYGEVVAVTADHHDFPSSVANRMRHPEPLACQPLARRYLGWDASQGAATGEPSGVGSVPAPAVDPSRALGFWRPVSTVSVGLLGPNIWQYLAGQVWIACVVYPQAAPYSGSVRGGLAGTAAAAFGSCQTVSEPPVRQRVSCDEPHTAEIFATARTTDADADALAASCRALVATVSGMIDPTAAGALSISVDGGGSFDLPVPPVNQDSSSLVFTNPSELESGQVSCVVNVVGDRQLIGSLTGVGDGPLPWAP